MHKSVFKFVYIIEILYSFWLNTNQINIYEIYKIYFTENETIKTKLVMEFIIILGFMGIVCAWFSCT